MTAWQDISTAPRDIGNTRRGYSYGPWILGYPVNGRVAEIRWWQSVSDPIPRNFLDAGGNAAFPTMWQPLPAPPDMGARKDGTT